MSVPFDAGAAFVGTSVAVGLPRAWLTVGAGALLDGLPAWPVVPVVGVSVGPGVPPVGLGVEVGVGVGAGVGVPPPGAAVGVGVPLVGLPVGVGVPLVGVSVGAGFPCVRGAVADGSGAPLGWGSAGVDALVATTSATGDW